MNFISNERAYHLKCICRSDCLFDQSLIDVTYHMTINLQRTQTVKRELNPILKRSGVIFAAKKLAARVSGNRRPFTESDELSVFASDSNGSEAWVNIRHIVEVSAYDAYDIPALERYYNFDE